MNKKMILEKFPGKYEINHYNPKLQRVQYNMYHNCNSPKDAMDKHEAKGFLKENIIGVTHIVKHQYTKEEVEALKS